MNTTVRNQHLLDLLQEIDEDGEDLSEWEIAFIADLIDNDCTVFSDRQEQRIVRIHTRCVGDHEND